MRQDKPVQQGATDPETRKHGNTEASGSFQIFDTRLEMVIDFQLREGTRSHLKKSFKYQNPNKITIISDYPMWVP